MACYFSNSDCCLSLSICRSRRSTLLRWPFAALPSNSQDAKKYSHRTNGVSLPSPGKNTRSGRQRAASCPMASAQNGWRRRGRCQTPSRWPRISTFLWNAEFRVSPSSASPVDLQLVRIFHCTSGCRDDSDSQTLWHLQRHKA